MDWKQLLIRILSFVKKQKATTIVIAVLVAIVFLQRACPQTEYVTEYKDKIIYETSTEYIYDTVEKFTEKKVFIYDSISYPVYDTIYTEIDVEALLKRFNAVKYFNDTLVQNDELFAYTRSIVSQNELQYRKFTYNIKRPTEIINTTTVINPKKNKLFLDLSIGGNGNMFATPIGLSYMTKTDKVYSFKYDPMNKAYYVGMSFKLFEHGNTK